MNRIHAFLRLQPGFIPVERDIHQLLSLYERNLQHCAQHDVRFLKEGAKLMIGGMLRASLDQYAQAITEKYFSGPLAAEDHGGPKAYARVEYRAALYAQIPAMAEKYIAEISCQRSL